MNTCENLETFCGYNGTASGQDKLCMLRQVIVDDTTEKKVRVQLTLQNRTEV